MAEQPKPVVETPKVEFKFNEENFSKKVNEIIAYYDPYKGKPNYNPFFALNKLTVLIARAERGERTEELYKSVMNFPLSEPIVNPKAVQQATPEAPKRVIAPGLNLPEPKK